MSNDFRINIRDCIKTYSSFIKLKQLLKDKCTLFPTQKLEIETWLISKDGQIKEHKKQIAHSFTIGWLKHIEGVISHAYNSVSVDTNITDIAGSSQTVAFVSNPQLGHIFGIAAPAGNTNYGIVCGTGTTAVRADDYTIETIIGHGSSSGQLNYGGTSIIPSSGSESLCQLSISRTVGNASGSSITVKNLGVLCSSRNTSAAQKYFLVIHDNCDQTIGSGETWLILYTIKTSISS